MNGAYGSAGTGGKEFLRRYLKIMIASVIMAAVLMGVGIVTIGKKADAEAKQSSYMLTEFDYLVTAPSAEQVADMRAHSSVKSVFPCYNFKVNARGKASASKTLFVMMCDSLDDYEIGLFCGDTCIAGGADAKGIMLDRTAAELLNVSVGDEVRFGMSGKSFTLSVCGIYMASTYQGYTEGLGLAVLTDEMKAAFDKSLRYKLAFIDANDGDACEEMLAGYVPRGELMTRDDYITDYKSEHNLPPNTTEEEWLAQIGAAYDEYVAKFESGKYPEAVQRKADYMENIRDKVASKESAVRTVSVSVAVSAALVYAILGSVFVLMNRRDDTVRREDGIPFGVQMRGYAVSSALGALGVAGSSLLVLGIYAAQTHFFAACMPVALLFSLPVLFSALAITAVAYGYLRGIYNAPESGTGRPVREYGNGERGEREYNREGGQTANDGYRDARQQGGAYRVNERESGFFARGNNAPRGGSFERGEQSGYANGNDTLRDGYGQKEYGQGDELPYRSRDGRKDDR